MASYQRVALFILFDAIETDLVHHIRGIAREDFSLTVDEHAKASRRLNRETQFPLADIDELNLLFGLDIGDKFAIIMRYKSSLDLQSKEYFSSLSGNFQRLISVRNDVMHGRPLTVDQHVTALAFAQSLVRKPGFWPTLGRAYTEYTDNPTVFLNRSINFLDEPLSSEVLNNLPVPDYDDTGFLPRPDLERDLKKKILGRHPVITVLGEGGNGKTALALQVLHGLVKSNDHDFDVIIWVSAKTSELTVSGVREISNTAVEAVKLMDAAAILEIREGSPRERLEHLLTENKVLLVIDNYETVVGGELTDIARDVPGQSKMLFTSRLPVGGDLTVLVGELAETDAVVYYRRLVDAYGITSLRAFGESDIRRFLKRLSYKPLLIKWLALGAKSGLDPEKVSSDPDTAMRFCLDNVIMTLNPEAQSVIVVLATLTTSASAGVIQYVSKLTAKQVNDGLAELSKYGLVELVVTEDGGQLFAIKPFSRTYIHRLINPRREITDKIIAAHRTLEGEFQTARGRAKLNRFSQKNFSVRSKTEMIIANKLKEATDYAFQGEFEVAEHCLVEAKALEPTYFETHRIEAFVAQQQNDWGRAIGAFETAISIAPSEPQLHFFFASLLMRLIENDRAAHHFEEAIKIEANSLVLREAARNAYMRYEFDIAQGYVDRAMGAGQAGYDDKTKIMDVQVQLYARKIEYYSRASSFLIAREACERLLEFIVSAQKSAFDQRMVAHLLKVIPPLFILRRSGADEGAPRDLLKYLEDEFLDDFGASAMPVSQEGAHEGLLKEEGRRFDFGFLESETCDDTFVHITRVSTEAWEWMKDGGRVRFDTEDAHGARRYATNVSIVN